MHEIWNIFWPKAFFWSIGNKKNIPNMSLGPPNQGFMQEKVQKGDFLKKNLVRIFVLGSYESLKYLEG